MILRIKEMYFFGTKPNIRNNQIGLYSFFISAEFKTGINFITGGLHECGPGLSYALCKGRLSRYDSPANRIGKDGYCKEFYLDNKIITLKQLQQMTYFIAGEDKFSWFSKNYRGKTVMEHLKAAEKKRKIDINEIMDTFGLDERVYRNIACLAGNRYRYSAAIGVAYGKKILCFPWLPCNEIHSEYLYSVLSKRAKDDNFIVIAPVENIKYFKDKFDYNEIIAEDLTLVYANGGVCHKKEVINDID